MNRAGSDECDGPLSADLLRKINAYWRAANYLSVGQIYLYDNPLLKVPLTLEQVFAGVMPFLAMDLVTLTLLIAFPSIVLFLPNLML